MNVFTISIRNLRFRALSTLFNMLVLALGIATIVTLLQLSEQIDRRFTHDLEGIDLVVGAKGSPIQLILSSVFHLDVPTGNIPLKEAEELEHNPMIKTAIPLALGDNYHGFRIVGTSPDYPKHYDAKMVQGDYWKQPMEAVLGSEVARAGGLKVGDHFVGSHGLSEGGDEHTQFPYTVTGILEPTGGVIDRLVLTDVMSVWNVHEHPDADEKQALAAFGAGPHEREITSLLIVYKSPYAAVTLPRLIDKSSAMQAASPATEMHRLRAIVGVGGETVRFFGGVLMAIAGAGFFVTLWGAVADRRYDIALMRSLGATRAKIFGMVLAEGLTLGACGIAMGLALGHFLSYLLGHIIEESRHIALQSSGFLTYETYLVAGALAVSAVVAIIPAIMAYRVNVAAVISRGA